MTKIEFWNRLDKLCASGADSGTLLSLSELLQNAADADLPLMIACRRTPGKIHHLYTAFSEGGNHQTRGNRYLICFSSQRQAETAMTHSANTSSGECGNHTDESLSLDERFRLIDEEEPDKDSVDDDLSLEERFRLIDEGGTEEQQKAKRRKKRKAKTASEPMWQPVITKETALVNTKIVLDYMKKTPAVGGLIFNLYDEKRSIALPKFLV